MSHEVSVSAEKNPLKFQTVNDDTELDGNAKELLDRNATYTEDVELEDFFAQLEPVRERVNWGNNRDVFRGFIRFDVKKEHGENRVCLESVNTANGRFMNLLPMSWRTNLKSFAHNMSVRTTLARAVLKKFNGLELDRLVIGGLLGGIQDNHLNAGANSGNGEQRFTLSSGNTKNALERREVDALRQRYFEQTLKRENLEKIAKATILKIAAQANGDLKCVPEDTAKAFFKDYLQGETLETYVNEMLERVEEYSQDSEVARDEDEAKGKLADANLKAMRGKCAGIREKLVRACINVHCRGLLKNTLHEAGANTVSYKVPDNEANEIAEFMTNYLKNLPDKDGSRRRLSEGEIQNAVKNFCKVGGGEKSCLGRCLQEIFAKLRGEPSEFNDKIRKHDFVADIAGKIQRFMRGYEAINAVADVVCAASGKGDGQQAVIIAEACGVEREDATEIHNFFDGAGDSEPVIKKNALNFRKRLAELKDNADRDGQTSSGGPAAGTLSNSDEVDNKKRMYEAFKAKLEEKKSALERLDFSSVVENDGSRKHALDILEKTSLPDSEEGFKKLVTEKLDAIDSDLKSIEETLKPESEPEVAQPGSRNPPAEGGASQATEQPGEGPEERREESDAPSFSKVFKDILQMDYRDWFLEKCFGGEQSDESKNQPDNFFMKYAGQKDYQNEKKVFADRCKNELLTQVADEIVRQFDNYGIAEGLPADQYGKMVDGHYESVESGKHRAELDRTAELTEADFANLPKNKNDLTHFINVGMALKSWYGVAVSVKNVGGNSSKITTVPMAVWSAILALKATKSTYDENHQDEAGFLKGLNDRFLEDKLLRNIYSVKDPRSVYNKLKDSLLGKAFLDERIDVSNMVKLELQVAPDAEAESDTEPKEDKPKTLATTLSTCTRQIHEEIENQVKGGFLGFFRGGMQKEVDDFRKSLAKLDAQRLYLLIGGSADRPDASVAKDPLADIGDNRAAFVEMAVLNYQRRLNVAFEKAIGEFAGEVAVNAHYLEAVSVVAEDGQRIAKAGFVRLRALIQKHCSEVKVQEIETLHSVMSKGGTLISPLIPQSELNRDADFDTRSNEALRKFYEKNVLNDDEKRELGNVIDKPGYEDGFRRAVEKAMHRVYPDLMTVYQDLTTFETYLKAGKLSNCYNTVFLDVMGDTAIKSARGMTIGERFLDNAVELLANHCNQLESGFSLIKKTFADRYFAANPTLLEGLDKEGKKNYRDLVERSVVYALSTDAEARESIMDINNLTGIREKKNSIFSFLTGDEVPPKDRVTEDFVNAYLGDKSNKDGKSFFTLLSEKIYQVESEWDPEARLGNILEADDFREFYLDIVPEFKGSEKDLKISVSEAAEFDGKDADGSRRSVLMSMAHTVTDVCLKELRADMRTNKQSYWGSDENLRSQSVKKLKAKIEKYWKNLMGNLSYFTEASGSRHLNPKDVEGLRRCASDISNADDGGRACRQLLLRRVLADDLKGKKPSTEAFGELLVQTVMNNATRHDTIVSTAEENSKTLVTQDLIANHKTSLANAIESVGLGIKDIDLPKSPIEQDDPVLYWYRVAYQNHYVGELEGLELSNESQGVADSAVSNVNDSFKRNLAALVSKLSKTLDCGALVDAFVGDNGIDSAEAEGLKEALKARMNDSGWTFLGSDGKTQMTLHDLVAQAYASAAYEMAVEPDKAKAAAAVVDAWKRHVDEFLMEKLGDKYAEALKRFAQSLSSDKAETYDFDALKGLSSVAKRRKLVYDLKVADSIEKLCDERLTEKRFQELFAAEGLNANGEEDVRPEYQDLHNPLKSVIDCQKVNEFREKFVAYVRGKMAELHKNAIRAEGIAAGGASEESEAERCRNLIEEQFNQFRNKRLLQRRAINRIYADIMGNTQLRGAFERAVARWTFSPGIFSANRTIDKAQRPAALLWMYRHVLNDAKKIITDMRLMEFPASVESLMDGKLFKLQNFTGKANFTAELKNYLNSYPKDEKCKQLLWLLGETNGRADVPRFVESAKKEVLNLFSQNKPLKVETSESSVGTTAYTTTVWRVMDDEIMKFANSTGNGTLKANDRNVLIFTTENKEGGK